MPRKWLVWSIVPLIALFVVGCPKKQPQTPDPGPSMEVETVPTPEPTPDPEPEVMEDPVEIDPLDSADLQVVNRALEDRGYAHNVYFEFDQSDLTPQARERLAGNAQVLREQGDLIITIEGHCDERGTNEYNLALGQRRAETAKEYLVSLGVDSARLRTISYGEERPVCTESTEGCWQQNRRDHMPATGRM